MLMEILIRVIAGGVMVSLFAILGDLLKPKGFAGLFGAAPSVALATVLLTVVKDGPAYVAAEARSMISGAAAFFVYACLARHFLLKGKWSALRVTITALPVWCVSAFTLWALFRK
jgi:uncharacterized membrane protein (GlpM family)